MLYTASPLRAFESWLRTQLPTGFLDTLGSAKGGDREAFICRRITEIKHGRVAMLATMGYIAPEVVGKFPSNLSVGASLKFADIQNGLAASSNV